MTLRIAPAMRAFGLLIVLSLLTVGATSLYALNQVRIGGAAYREIADVKDLTADILPPPLYLVEAHLTVMELSANPATLAESRKKLEGLHRDFDTRMAFWRTRKVDTAIGTILFTHSDRAATRFWSTTETELIPAVAAGDTVKVEAASKDINAAYEAQRDAVESMAPLLNAEAGRTEAAAAKAVASEVRALAQRSADAAELASQTKTFRTTGGSAPPKTSTPARPSPRQRPPGSRESLGLVSRSRGATALKAEVSAEGWEEF